VGHRQKEFYLFVLFCFVVVVVFLNFLMAFNVRHKNWVDKICWSTTLFKQTLAPLSPPPHVCKTLQCKPSLHLTDIRVVMYAGPQMFSLSLFSVRTMLHQLVSWYPNDTSEKVLMNSLRSCLVWLAIRPPEPAGVLLWSAYCGIPQGHVISLQPLGNSGALCSFDPWLYANNLLNAILASTDSGLEATSQMTQI